MIRPKKRAWQISMRHAGNIVLAVPLAAGAALIAWKLSFWRILSQTLGLAFFLVTFVVFAVVFYSLLERYAQRPDEIAKRVPITSKELRRRTKEFYDNLSKRGSSSR